MGVPELDLDAETIARICELKAGQVSIRAIASEFGLSTWAVMKVLEGERQPRERVSHFPVNKPTGRTVEGVPRIDYVAARRNGLAEPLYPRAIALLATGRSAPRCASILGLPSPTAFRNRCSRIIYPILGADNAASAVHICNQKGIFIRGEFENTSIWGADELTRAEVIDHVVREYRAGQNSRQIAEQLKDDGHAIHANQVLVMLRGAGVEIRKPRQGVNTNAPATGEAPD